MNNIVKKYKKRPVIIEAILWDGENDKIVKDFLKCNYAFIGSLPIFDKKNRNRNA